MTKSAQAFRTIREVADWLGVAAHVLRFWESKFPQIKPVKRAGGRRYYRPSDMELVGGIKVLLHDQGMTIRGVQKLIRSEGIAAITAHSPPLTAEAAPPDGADAWQADAAADARAEAPKPTPEPTRPDAAETESPAPADAAADPAQGPAPEPVDEGAPDADTPYDDSREPALPFGLVPAGDPVEEIPAVAPPQPDSTDAPAAAAAPETEPAEPLAALAAIAQGAAGTTPEGKAALAAMKPRLVALRDRMRAPPAA